MQQSGYKKLFGRYFKLAEKVAAHWPLRSGCAWIVSGCAYSLAYAFCTTLLRYSTCTSTTQCYRLAPQRPRRTRFPLAITRLY